MMRMVASVARVRIPVRESKYRAVRGRRPSDRSLRLPQPVSGVGKLALCLGSRWKKGC
jgi:hypothetical protein